MVSLIYMILYIYLQCVQFYMYRKLLWWLYSFVVSKYNLMILNECNDKKWKQQQVTPYLFISYSQNNSVSVMSSGLIIYFGKMMLDTETVAGWLVFVLVSLG